MIGWLWLIIGGLVGWGVIELDRLNYLKQWGLKFRTSLVAGAWVVMAVFAVSSSASRWTTGLVLGVGLHLVYEYWQSRLIWPVKREVSETEQKIFGVGLTLVWIILTLWAL
mgnify:CR=1 FL=1